MFKMNKLTRIMFLLLLLSTLRYPLNATHAAVPHLINYQGRLTDANGVALNGSYSITFRIYDAETAGNLLWEETHTGVVIQKRIFSILLSSVNDLNLPFDKQYFLEIKVGDEVMSPRQRIASVGYAIRAKVADSLPNDVILMCRGICPPGYKRIGILDGKFLVGGSTYNPAAGGSNTHSHTLNARIGTPIYRGNAHYLGVTTEHWGGPWGDQYEKNRYGVPSETLITSVVDNRPEFATVVLCEKE